MPDRIPHALHVLSSALTRAATNWVAEPWGPVGAVLMAWYAMIGPNHWEMMVIVVAAMGIDYVTGIYKAWRAGRFCTEALYAGVLKKLARGLLVPIGLLLDRLTILMVPGDSQLDAIVTNGLPWLSFALGTLAVGEIVSSLQNIREAEGRDSVARAMLSAVRRMGRQLSVYDHEDEPRDGGTP